MNPTSGVIGEAWSHYKQHASHLLPIAFVVYLLIALLSAILTAAWGSWERSWPWSSLSWDCSGSRVLS